MRALLLCFLCSLSFLLPAQSAAGPYAVGYRDLSFTDNGLNTPNVSVRVYYPAVSAGANAAAAAGVFPAVAFGHGFNLNYLDYEILCGHLAGHGYYVITPDVQNGFSVSHLEYARELGACLNYLQAEGANVSSWAAGHIDANTGVMGHSMGGGASCLVPGVYPDVDAVLGLAAAETNPSAVTALQSWVGPLGMISGSQDNVAPEATNQQAMYNAGAGAEKFWFSLQGGAHCKFTDANTICDLVSGAGTLTRPQQIQLTARYMTAFFDYYLKASATEYVFLCGDSLNADVTAGRVVQATTSPACAVSRDNLQPALSFSAGPVPVQQILRVEGAADAVLYTLQGTALPVPRSTEDDGLYLDLSRLPAGFYLLRKTGTSETMPILKQ